MSREKYVSSDTFLEKCFTNLNRQRKKGFFCDVQLIVNGKKFSAHRAVLAASSEYFATMFRTNMKKKYTGVVDLKEVSIKTIKEILEFIYSGEIKLYWDNVVPILQAATLFQMQDLLRCVEEYTSGIVSPSNSLQLREISEFFSLSALAQKTENCILKNFDKICMSKKFLDLSKSDVQYFLGSNEINVEVEDVLFTSLVNWTNHDLQARQEDFFDLFSCIRLQFVTKGFLSNTVRKEKLVRNDTKCRDLVDDAMHFQIEPDAFEKQEPRSNSVYKEWFLLTPTSKIQTLHLKGTTSCKEAQSPFHVSYNSAIALHENKVMFCGRFIISFDGKVWKKEGDLKFPRCDAAAVSVKGVLYIFGGINNSRYENHTEKFLDGQLQLDEQKNLLRNRSAACAVVIGDMVYLIGGHSTAYGYTQEVLASVDCINTLTNQWSTVSPLNQKRENFAASAVRDIIYVFGGNSNNNEHLSSAEFLDTSCDNPTWTFLPPTPVPLPHASSCLICHYDEIFVLGGTTSQTWNNTVVNVEVKTQALFVDGAQKEKRLKVSLEKENSDHNVAGSKIFGLKM